VSPATTCARICRERKKLTNTQGKAEAAQAQVGTVSARAKGSLAEARTSGVELANVNDVKLRDVRIDVDGSTPQTGLKIAWIIIGCVCLYARVLPPPLTRLHDLVCASVSSIYAHAFENALSCIVQSDGVVWDNHHLLFDCDGLFKRLRL